SPVTAEALASAIDRAEAESRPALVIEIDTPGGLESSMREMVTHMLAARVPLVTWVAPSGARAASAGVFVTMAGDVAAMAPGTNIGAATPVNLQGGMDSTLARKVTNDAAAFARTVAHQRGRNAVWAEQAVRQAVAASETEALALHVVDVIAPSLDSLLAAADGRDWARNGVRRPLRLRGLPYDDMAPSPRQRLLGWIVDPNIAYLLMLLGFYGLLFELQNPGSVLPGVVGGIALVLAFLALSALPVNAAGIALICLALVFFLAEIKVASHGVLAAGGILAMLLGSLILYRGAGIQLSWSVMGGAIVGTTVFFLLVIGAGLRARRWRVRTGWRGMVGRRAQVVQRLTPSGTVWLDGTTWNARSESDAEVDVGSEVIVMAVDGLTLRVRPV
ncbi:MAG TPA: nodulation protein NfeD, partial [Candidatus Eisenbacteria bacterium]|nr:nodulation protein NfeD [Candidatus Eisenbacteria bacterium]